MTQTSLEKIIAGYQEFRKKYVEHDNTLMRQLASQGQTPEIMVVACSDSRVDPALLLQCDPGDLFVVRNVANIVPPYENDEFHHGTSAALEFAVCYLNVKHLVILGHSQCGGIHALLNQDTLHQNDFISNWVNLLAHSTTSHEQHEICARTSLLKSYENCLTFPWIHERLAQGELSIHLWFFDIAQAEILAYSFENKEFSPLV